MCLSSIILTTSKCTSIQSNSLGINRKDRSQLIPLILEILNGRPLRRYKIIQKSRLPYNQVNTYLKLLANCNLISLNDHDLSYKTTVKGLYYLRLHDQMSELLPLIRLKSEYVCDQ